MPYEILNFINTYNGRDQWGRDADGRDLQWPLRPARNVPFIIKD